MVRVTSRQDITNLNKIKKITNKVTFNNNTFPKNAGNLNFHKCK